MLKGMEKALKKEEIVGSDGSVAMDLVRQLENDMMGTFAADLRDKT